MLDYKKERHVITVSYDVSEHKSSDSDNTGLNLFFCNAEKSLWILTSSLRDYVDSHRLKP